MIRMDDAGWGCLIGGVLIGAYRPETEEFRYGEIPVSCFQDTGFARQEYLDAGANVVQRLFTDLAVSKSEPVEVCTGHVLGGIRDWLIHEKYDWRPAKITDSLQILIETALLQTLQGYGLKVDYETLTEKQGLLFWKCLRWLKGGNIDATRALPKREKLAKTGWATYRIWVENPYAVAKQKAAAFKAARRRAGWR
jgi:hypothetical protein